MVRTLVITIDRDNDLESKLAFEGQLLEENPALAAALRLGIADPEESDTNAILGALNHHDRLAENAEPSDEVER